MHGTQRLRRGSISLPFVFIAITLSIVLSQCDRIIGASVEPICPKQTLTPAQTDALYAEVKTLINDDHEHHPVEALRQALPLLEEGTLNGHKPSRDRLTSHLIQAGIIDMTNGPFAWRSSASVAQEGIMWMIVGAHLGDPITPQDSETFRILLDPSIPLPSGFNRQQSGTAWMLQMLPEFQIERARRQAYAWRECWPRSN